ncbi:MAG: serine/threonine-protein kinase, partial [Planctomycetota bacterium]|nr:serine/threonine-protein kinase [Planctomycetota bacterium]
VQRFALERKLLSALNHPNIARMYDGGATEDGRPYFVMEYIEGMPIDRYCDSHKLRVGERLELFRKVCMAVHHMHQNLVVHRDLKPGNILVTKDGEPKVVDFGIAKLLNPEMAGIDLAPTATEMRLMTPEYASPEQVRGEPITTASDVYSLGVLLYELLTGHRPYRLKSRLQAEIERIICDTEPDRPCTAVSLVEEFAFAAPD